MTTALYRRYRPDTFADVIGQEHVTAPLMQALRDDRVNHAYLFSGPRGCGKTTSARILARCLNCAQGPTDTPCGECDSCRDLATGGPGSLDVVEIDAASHNGVDDARDLRERAFFAPARDRFKVFILDEAHMVTTQGFNALLKLVEEPPPHITFIFATTEPEKVIGTIRSRTHHYPFRLVPPPVLSDYLGKVAAAESVQLDRGVLGLVVRAGGGSVRDSLSVLDQLIAGSGGAQVDYTAAVGLLGYTHAALLDEVVDALAGRDGAGVFSVIDRVISSGHEPRRFVEDLLERLRDLIVLAAAPREAEAVLRAVPADQLARMSSQAEHLGFAATTTAADLTNAALTSMVGATAPRMHLELLAARLLLALTPAGALAQAGSLAPAGPAAKPSADTKPRADKQPSPDTQPVEAPVARAGAAPKTGAQPASAQPAGSASARVAKKSAPPDTTAAPASADAPAAAAASGPTGEAPAGKEEAFVRSRWNEVMSTLRDLSKVTWMFVDQNAVIRSVTDDEVVLAFVHSGHVQRFASGPDRARVETALRESLGIVTSVRAVHDGQPAPPAAAIATTWEPVGTSAPTRAAASGAAASGAAASGAHTPPPPTPTASTPPPVTRDRPAPPPKEPPTVAPAPTEPPPATPSAAPPSAAASGAPQENATPGSPELADPTDGDLADIEPQEPPYDPDETAFAAGLGADEAGSHAPPPADIVVREEEVDFAGSTEVLTGIELIKQDLGGRVIDPA